MNTLPGPGPQETAGENSRRLFDRACRVMPGGVNSPVRAFGAVGGNPVFNARGQGSRIFSADDREFVDFCGSWGALLLGHAHPAVIEAVQRAAACGTSFGTCTEGEVELAELISNRIPSMEMVRLAGSGTEACMTALRLARGYTGREMILKFEGCYHGHADPLLVAAGSGLLTGGRASSAGVQEEVAAKTLVAPYNDADAVEKIFKRHKRDIAAVIVEPVACNMGLVRPLPGFLEHLRRLTGASGTLLIFDEVITGFRFAPYAYSGICGIEPDLSCLGKIMGGGLPAGAVGGRRDIMKMLAPGGPVYQAGTLNGNPVAVAAGLATLKTAITENPYPAIAEKGKHLATGLESLIRKSGITAHVEYSGGIWTIFFGRQPMVNLTQARTADTTAYAVFFKEMLSSGFYMPPSQFEVCFVSAAHSSQDVERFLASAATALQAVAAGAPSNSGETPA